METNKHTKGGWTINPHHKTIVQCNDKQLIIANCSNEYDAKLIAAAPQLLEGLQMIVDKRNNAGWDAECCALLAEQLIKKATE